MSECHWMLELQPSGWRLHSGRGDISAILAEHEFVATDPVASAAAIQAALVADGYTGEAVMIALGSEWCLATTLPVSRLQELRDRRTMHYRLEESIPWSAEECVSDYRAAGSQAFAVAAPCDPLANFVRALEGRGVVIQSIVPTTLLAVAVHLDEGEWPVEHAILWEEHGVLDLLRIQSNQVLSWSWSSAGTMALSRELSHAALETGSMANLVIYSLEESARTAIQAGLSVPSGDAWLSVTAGRSGMALAASRKILQGQLEPPLDLKRGPFGQSGRHTALHRHWTLLQVAAALLLITLAGGFAYRGQAAARLTESFVRQQTDVFRAAFPTAKVPIGIKSRLESELANRRALHGDNDGLPGITPAATMLYRLLASLPTDRRYRMLEIRIEEGTLYLDGEVRVHGDAEVIAQRLRGQGCTATPPRTQRLDDRRVSLRLSGKLQVPETAVGGKTR